jgi:hypothetical protein
MWADSFASQALAGWIRSPSASRTRVTGSWASQSISRPGTRARSSRAMARSRRAWPSPMGEDRYRARFGRRRARVQVRVAGADTAAPAPPAPDPAPPFPDPTAPFPPTPANPATSSLTLTGSRAMGMWPAPSRVTRAPSVASASARPRRGGLIWSSSPWTTSTGQRLAAHQPRRVASSTQGAWDSAIRTSGEVSRPQPTLSSICLVECRSVKHWEKKNSRKSW